jgi:hypothetical protein
MREERLVSVVQKGLLIKSILLSVLVFGIVFSHPAVNLLQVGAHQVCQWTAKHAQHCRTA